MSKEQHKEVTDVSLTRNSSLRKNTAGITRSIAEKIDHFLPFITPDMLTALSTAGTIYGGHFANKDLQQKHNKKIALGIIATAQVLDALDGALARVRQRNNKKNNKNGQLVDALGDRASEAGLGLERAAAARRRQDKLGEYAALLATFTNPLPSSARAFAEINGKVVDESGKSPFDFIGTRAGRAISGTIATIFPNPNNFPLQTTLDSLTACANIKTTIERLNKVDNKNHTHETTLPLEDKEKAKIRFKAMVIFSAVTAGVVIYTMSRNRKK